MTLREQCIWVFVGCLGIVAWVNVGPLPVIACLVTACSGSVVISFLSALVRRGLGKQPQD